MTDNMPGKPLNPARQRFCFEIVKNGQNATQAYRIAYPNCKSGHKQAGQRLMTYVDVKQEIGRLQAETRAGSVKSRKQRQEFWTDMMDDEDASRMDRLRASELLGKSEADFITVTRDETETPNILSPDDAELYKQMALAALQRKYGPKLAKETG